MKVIVFVDVDMTLIDQNDNPRPHVHEFFQTLREDLDCYIIVWSAGGQDYAEQKIGMVSRRIEHDLTQYVDTFLWKMDYDLVKSDYPRFFIDDHKELLKYMANKNHGIFKVPEYDSVVCENDDWLLRALNNVRKFLNERNSRTTNSDNGDKQETPSSALE